MMEKCAKKLTEEDRETSMVNKRLKRVPESGEIIAIASKSMAHRMMIAAALSKINSKKAIDTNVDNLVDCKTTSKDIEATRACLKEILAGLNAEGAYLKSGALSSRFVPNYATKLMCGESGSTLRFLLPIVGALGIEAEFYPEGRLPGRPLSPLYEEMQKKGCILSKQGEVPFKVKGALKGGVYEIDGNISSQFITGLLFALPLLKEDSFIKVKGELESRPYVDMTLEVLEESGIKIEETKEGFKIPANQKYSFKEGTFVEGDWSNAAFWLSLGALSKEGIKVKGLNLKSKQGDKKILDILSDFGADVTVNAAEGEVKVKGNELNAVDVDAKDVPDLVPIVSVVAAAAKGKSHIINAERLRIKESDRLKTVHEMLSELGINVKETSDGLEIEGMDLYNKGPLKSEKEPVINSFNDHRIAMSAAISAKLIEGDLIVEDANAVEKSYPGFFDDYEMLGGIID